MITEENNRGIMTMEGRGNKIPSVTEENQDREERIDTIHNQLLQEALARLSHNKERAVTNAKKNTESIDAIIDAFQTESEDRVEELRRIAEKMYHAEQESQIDEKSGLYREPAFAEMYTTATESIKEGEKAIFIAFDIDRFRQINSGIGHVQADLILKKIGDQFKTLSRVGDIGCRIGGDEFIFLFNHIGKDISSEHIIKRFTEAISTITWGENQIPITISAGYEEILPNKQRYLAQVREQADKASGIAKKFGRNRLARISEDTFAVFEFNQGEYLPSENGSVHDLGITSEQCEHDVKTALQRVLEEIERYHGANLTQYLRETYGVETFEELSLKSIAHELYRTRRAQE